MKCLVELGLLQKPLVQELLCDVAPFVCHPGVWVRQGAVGFITSVARTYNVADVHCRLLPLLQNFLKHSVIQVQDEVSVCLLGKLLKHVIKTSLKHVIETR